MDIRNDSLLSCYQDIAVISEEHHIYLVRNLHTGEVCVKKILDVYNPDIYYKLLSHPVYGVPRVYEFLENDPASQAVLIEEYISGRTLEELITNKSLTQLQVGQIICNLCDILTSLHTMDPPVIHRDIKPSNIMITYSGRTILIDLNAARVYHQDEDAGREQDTVLLGTKGYAAPEQYGFGTSTPRTDIYALGIVIREMEKSLPGEETSGLSQDVWLTADREAGRKDQSAGSVRLLLDQVADKCTQLRPLDRYASAADVKKAVKTALCGTGAVTGTGSGKGSMSSFATVPDSTTSDGKTGSWEGHDRAGQSTFYDAGQREDSRKKRPVVSPGTERRKYRKFLPPGFRSGNPLFMLLAGAGYAYLTFLCIFQIPHYHDIVDAIPGYLFPYVTILMTVFVWGNYLGIQKTAPFHTHKNRFVRFLGVLILNAVILFAMMVVTDMVYRSLS